MMNVYEIDGLVPVVDPTAFVHPTAVLIGDVIIGPGCYVGPSACLRGDFGRLILEQGANVQDTCVMHAFPNIDCVIAQDGHIGHGAVLHGCRVGRNAMVGMNAVVMDNAIIGENSVVAAMAFVNAELIVPPRTLVAGVPARLIRELSDQEIAWKSMGTATYHELAVRSMKTMKTSRPLAAVEPGRKRIQVGEIYPLNEARRKFGD